LEEEKLVNVKRSFIGAVVCAMLCLTIALVTRAQGPAAAPVKIYNAAKLKLMAGIKLGGPQNWKNRPGYRRTPRCTSTNIIA
jgi:hypothetical protein